MKLIFAADHAGVELKTLLTQWATVQGHDVIDLGPHDDDSVDYPDYAFKLVDMLSDMDFPTDSFGILICGTGVGMSIAANRNKDIRAALCFDAKQAEFARAKNHANVLCLGSSLISLATAEEILRTFITTQQLGDRHERRVSKL